MVIITVLLLVVFGRIVFAAYKAVDSAFSGKALNNELKEAGSLIAMARKAGTPEIAVETFAELEKRAEKFCKHNMVEPHEYPKLLSGYNRFLDEYAAAKTEVKKYFTKPSPSVSEEQPPASAPVKWDTEKHVQPFEKIVCPAPIVESTKNHSFQFKRRTLNHSGKAGRAGGKLMKLKMFTLMAL